MSSNWNQTNTNQAQAPASNGYFTPPPMTPPPAFNPYQQQGYAPNGYGQPPHPMQFYSRLKYEQEPTTVDIIADLLRDNNQPMRFWVDGGFSAFLGLQKILLLQTLNHYFKNVKINVVQDESGMFLQVASEQLTDEGKRIQTITDSDVAAEVSSIASAAKSNVLDTADANIKLHRDGAIAAAQSGAVSAMMEGLIGEEPGKNGGVMSAVGGAVGAGLRGIVGLPPANRGPPQGGV